ncbi:MAG: hypothetical protein SFW62_09410 [Alphaproteobacteria bacterium]|nr:hypothetical protein [Alphaproteobacteria bacterium]
MSVEEAIRALTYGSKDSTEFLDLVNDESVRHAYPADNIKGWDILRAVDELGLYGDKVGILRQCYPDPEATAMAIYHAAHSSRPMAKENLLRQISNCRDRQQKELLERMRAQRPKKPTPKPHRPRHFLRSLPGGKPPKPKR